MAAPTYLHTIAVSAASHFGAATEASITMLDHGAVVRAASSSRGAARCDQVESRTGDGPCVVAMQQQQVVSVLLPQEDRWPEWRREAAEQGFASLLAVPAPVAPGMAVSLNLYSPLQDPWDARARLDADAYARQIAGAVEARLHPPAAALVADITADVYARRVIEQAVGVLMHANACAAETALATLRESARERGAPLTEAASIVLRTLDGTGALREP